MPSQTFLDRVRANTEPGGPGTLCEDVLFEQGLAVQSTDPDLKGAVTGENAAPAVAVFGSAAGLEVTLPALSEVVTGGGRDGIMEQAIQKPKT